MGALYHSVRESDKSLAVQRNSFVSNLTLGRIHFVFLNVHLLVPISMLWAPKRYRAHIGQIL